MDCRICGQYMGHNVSREENTCVTCQYQIDAFEAHGLELTFCKECLFADTNYSGNKIFCHRNAPSIMRNVHTVHKWAEMMPNEWCGQGKKR